MPKCFFHERVEAEIENTKKQVDEIKVEEKKQLDKLENIWKVISRQPSTATLLVGLGIFLAAVMSIVGLVYQAHQKGSEKMEKRIEANAEEIKKVNDRLDKQFSGVIKSLTLLNDKMPEKIELPKKERRK